MEAVGQQVHCARAEADGRVFRGRRPRGRGLCAGVGDGRRHRSASDAGESLVHDLGGVLHRDRGRRSHLSRVAACGRRYIQAVDRQAVRHRGREHRAVGSGDAAADRAGAEH